MKTLQAYYTSCRHGLSGRAGYQIRALTPGIEPVEELDIERRSFYHPPRDTRQAPDAECLELLPRDFRFGRLSSGRAALTLTTYLGRDYSGRSGNFFSHTLVFTEESARWPIDYFEWEGWKRDLDEGEDEAGEPEPLPDADLAAVPAAESFTLDELQEFLGEEEGRVQYLEAMLRAVFAGRPEKRPLVIRDAPNEGLYWLACIQKAFPVPHALSLSFSSYQFETHECSDLNITTAATAFTFNRDEREFQFYVFDPAEEEAHEVPEEGNDFPALAARWMAEDPKCLERFHDFMEHFDHRTIDRDLTLAGHLFELLEGRSAALSEMAVTEALGLVEGSATAVGFGRILELLHQAPREDLDVAVEIRVLSFLIRGACRPEQAEHRLLAAAAWRDFFERRAWDGGEGFQAVEEAFRELENTWAGEPPDLARELLPLSQPPSPRLEPEGAPSEVLLFLLRRTVSWLIDLGTSPAGSEPQVSRLLQALRARDPHTELLDLILAAADPRDPVVLADFCAFFAGSPELGSLLAERLRRQSKETVIEVRTRLLHLHRNDLLRSEALATVEKSEDQFEAFEAYRQQVASLPELWRQQAGPLVEMLRGQDVSRHYFCRQALSWLHDGLLEELPQPLASKLASVVNRQISINPEDTESARHAERLQVVAAHLKFKLRPDNAGLRELVARAQAPELTLDHRDRARLIDAQELTAGEYEFFLSKFLPPALVSIVDPKEHGEVLRNLSLDEKRAYLAQSYLAWLDRKRRELWSEDREAALVFWLRQDPAKASREFGSLRQEALEVLSGQLCRLKRALWAELVERLNRTIAPPGVWLELHDELDRRRKRGLGWMFR